MDNTGNSVGEILRKTREQKGLTIQQVNDATKISPEVIRALEQDDHGSFDSEMYLKGFLKSYASQLGLDFNRLWDMLHQRKPGAPSEPQGGTFWDIEDSIHEEKLRSPRIFRRYVLPALFVAIAVLALLLYMEHRKVKRLSTSASSHHVEDGVISRAGDV